MASPKPLGGVDGILVNVQSDGICIYRGLTVRETAGAAASFRIRVNSVSGTILETVALAANDSISMWFDDDGKVCNGDLFEDFIAGVYEGSVFVT